MISKVAAVGSVAVAFVSLVAAAVLDAAVTGGQRAEVHSDPGWYAGVSGLALAVPGALLLWRMPRHLVAWVLCLTGAHWALDGLAGSYLTWATLREPALPGASLSFWIYQRLGASLLLSLPLVLLLYPDGKLPSGRWRIASYVSLAATSVLPLALLVVPSTVADAATDTERPAPFAGLNLDPTTIPLTEGIWSALMPVAYLLVPVGLLVPVAVVFARYRAADGPHRVRMRWLLWAALVDLLVMLSMAVLPRSLTSVGLVFAVTLTGFAVTVGIVRPYLLDIDRLLGGTLLYAALAGSVVLVDIAVVGLARTVLGERLDQRDAALAALLLVLTVYGPLRHRLWLLVRRIALGRRDDWYGVVAGLAERLERTDSPEEQLLATARAVAEAFRVRYVAVEVERTEGRRLLAEHGERPEEVRSLPITYRGEEVGRLVLPARGARGGTRSGRDARLLADVVRQAAAAARSGYLAEELQRGRERIVAAGRRSGAASGVTCTTGSGPAWAGSRCASRPPETSSGPARGRGPGAQAGAGGRGGRAGRRAPPGTRPAPARPRRRRPARRHPPAGRAAGRAGARGFRIGR